MDINFLKIVEYRYIGMGRSVETIQHLDYSMSALYSKDRSVDVPGS